MDERLVAWARTVKARNRPRWPVLWLFTDARRVADPIPAIARLPKGIGGVVFRHDGVPGRTVLARRIAAVCRERRLLLSVAGDWRLAARLGAGVHVRIGSHSSRATCRAHFVTVSCHSSKQIVQARLLQPDIVFVSPVFSTASHPDAHPLGCRRWIALARSCGGQPIALGGMSGLRARGLMHPACCGAAAIGAWSEP